MYIKSYFQTSTIILGGDLIMKNRKLLGFIMAAVLTAVSVYSPVFADDVSGNRAGQEETVQEEDTVNDNALSDDGSAGEPDDTTEPEENATDEACAAQEQENVTDHSTVNKTEEPAPETDPVQDNGDAATPQSYTYEENSADEVQQAVAEEQQQDTVSENSAEEQGDGYEDRTIETEASGHRITATGRLSEGLSLRAEKITWTEEIEDGLNEEGGSSKVKVYDAFDIELIDSEGNVWQPVEHDTEVSIRIEGLGNTLNEIEETRTEAEEAFGDFVDVELGVTRIDDESGEATELEASSDGNAVEFATEHFTTFVISGVTYDTSNADATVPVGIYQDYVAGYTSDVNLYWFADRKVAIIAGTGRAEGVHYALRTIGCRDTIEEVYVMDGVTELASHNDDSDTNGSFLDCTALTKCELADSVSILGKAVFNGCTSLETITLPDGIEVLPAFAFGGCTNLASIHLPSGLTTINGGELLDYGGAFRGCSSLELPELPESLTYIGDYAFGNCSSLVLEEIPDQVNYIGKGAFRYTGLTSIKLPSGITSIESDTFYCCDNLSKITGGDNVTSVASGSFGHSYVSGSLSGDYGTFLKTESEALKNYNWGRDFRKLLVTWDISKDQDESILAIWDASENKLSIEGAGEIKDYNVTEDDCDYPFADYFYSRTVNVTISEGITHIGDGLFWRFNGMRTFNLPSTLKSIGKMSFYVCQNTNMTGTFPDGLESVGEGAFWHCLKLVGSGNIPSSLTRVDKNAFMDCEQLALGGDFPSGLTDIGEGAFSDCREMTVGGTLPDGLTEIPDNAFLDCHKMTISGEIPSGVTSIGDFAFEKCWDMLLTGELPLGLTSIGESAFKNDTTFTIGGTLPAGLTSIGESAFSQCEEMTIEGALPEGLTSIGSYAFYDCLKMNISGAFPSSLRSIGDVAFGRCEWLTKISYHGSSLTIGENAFFPNCEGESSPYNSTKKLLTMLDTENTRLLSYDWESDYRQALVPFTIDGVTYSPVDADDLWDVSKARDYSVIAYWYADAGKLVINGVGETKDGNTEPRLHQGVSGNYDIIMSDGITDIGEELFYALDGAESIRFPNDLETIKGYSFWGCGGGDIVIPDSVTNIEEAAFYGAHITGVTLPAGMTELAARAFQGSNVANVTFPAGLEVIGTRAFEQCDNITDITLPASLKTISNSAFLHCLGLTEIEISAGVETIGDGAFAGCRNLTAITYNGGDTLTSLGSTTFDGYLASDPSYLYVVIPTDLDTNSSLMQEYDWPSSTRSVMMSWDISAAQDGSVLAQWNNTDKVLTIKGNGSATKNYAPKTTGGLEPTIPRGGQVNPIGSLNPGMPAIQVYNESTSGVLNDASPIYTNIRNEDFAVVFDAPNLTNIGDNLFFQCVGMDMTELPDTITTIGTDAFYDCEALSLASLPDGLTTLGKGAFYNCQSLAVDTIPNGINTYPQYVFAGCGNLALTSLPDVAGVTMDVGAFKCCTSLALTELPSSLTVIPSAAFYGCSDLALTELPSGVTSIGAHAFAGDKLVSISSLPASLATIDIYGFSDCQAMDNIVGGSELTDIGVGTFYVSTPYSVANKLSTRLTTTNDVLKNYTWATSNRKLASSYTITLPAEIRLEKSGWDSDVYVDANGDSDPYIWELESSDLASDEAIAIAPQALTDTVKEKMKGSADDLRSIATGTGFLNQDDKSVRFSVILGAGSDGKTDAVSNTCAANRIRANGTVCNDMEVAAGTDGSVSGRIHIVSGELTGEGEYAGTFTFSTQMVRVSGTP